MLALAPDQEEASQLLADAERRLALESERRRRRAVPPAPSGSRRADRHGGGGGHADAATAAGGARGHASIDFFTEVPEGVLTVYADDRQIVREQFRFSKRTGFLRSEKQPGTLHYDKQLPSGRLVLRIYVAVLDSRPARSPWKGDRRRRPAGVADSRQPRRRDHGRAPLTAARRALDLRFCCAYDRAVAPSLTRKQKEILEFLVEFEDRHGLAPTHREICQRFGFRSYGTAHKHLRLLAEKGSCAGKPTGGGDGGSSPRRVRGAGGDAALPRTDRRRPAIEALPDPESLTVPAWLVAGRGQTHFVLRVAGESMIEEGIHDGDWVVVERRERAQPGEMVVALVGQEVTLKRYFPEGELVRLQPANPAMTPLFVPAGEVAVQGIVVGLLRRF